MDKKELNLLTLNKSGASEREIIEAAIDLINDTIKRDRFVRKLAKEIENESKKYYNEVEIK